MKLRLTIFSIVLLLISVGSSSPTLAQEQKKEEKESTPDLKRFSVKLFEVKHRIPSALRDALWTLGSGAKGADINANNNLNTLTVRDFPENIAAIEEALKRLDVPDKPPVSLECQL